MKALVGFILGCIWGALVVVSDKHQPKPQKKDYFEKVNTQTFIEISTRLDKVDSLYLEIDSLTKIK